MGNEVATRGNSFLAVNDQDFLSKLEGEASGFRTGGGAYMKMDGNTGDYSYGADNIELPVGTQLAMFIDSYRRGFLIWKDGDVVDEVMVGLMEGPKPSKTSLTDHGPYGEEDGPREQATVEFKLLEEPFVQMTFQANNSSKRRALEAVIKDFTKGYKSNPGCYPIIEIGSKEFEAKDPKNPKRKFKKHAPTFKIVSWMTAEELMDLAEGNPADYEQEAPAEEEVQAAPAPRQLTAGRAQTKGPVPATGNTTTRKSRF